ncbi:hypothetical protein UNDYM_4477 [Undibacterium sp. YM2]|nr:hypothetical protein UNDYM_4477 [Undibacterium sp. YM2]
MLLTLSISISVSAAAVASVLATAVATAATSVTAELAEPDDGAWATAEDFPEMRFFNFFSMTQTEMEIDLLIQD